MENNLMPKPIIDEKERKQLETLTEEYNKLVAPSKLAVVKDKIADIVPMSVKETLDAFSDNAAASKYYKSAMEYVEKGIDFLESYLASTTISRSSVVERANKKIKNCCITEYEEICLLRSYDIGKLIPREKLINVLAALTEGGATGYVGFVGIPFNLVLSTLAYYRAVQSVAITYGYDVKSDPEEMVLAGEVFIRSLNPNSGDSSEIGSVIGKIMIFAESTSLKQATKKGWTSMISHGGAGLLITQMRALANKAAQKALAKAGKNGIENSVFKTVFEQIGKNLSLKATGKALPAFSAVAGALIDVGTMNEIVKFANIFYQKRFIMEKETRINRLLGIENEEFEIFDADIIESECDSSEEELHSAEMEDDKYLNDNVEEKI